VLDVVSGGILKFKGVATNIAHGEKVLGGTNPTAVATGLTTPASCTLTLKNTSAPTPTVCALVRHLVGDAQHLRLDARASLNAFSASPGTETVGWTCKGT
jgi:hypothetical protein